MSKQLKSTFYGHCFSNNLLHFIKMVNSHFYLCCYKRFMNKTLLIWCAKLSFSVPFNLLLSMYTGYNRRFGWISLDVASPHFIKLYELSCLLKLSYYFFLPLQQVKTSPGRSMEWCPVVQLAEKEISNHLNLTSQDDPCTMGQLKFHLTRK